MKPRKAKPPSPVSTHKRIQVEVRSIMRGRSEIKLRALQIELTKRLSTPIRVDYLVANLMGQKGLVIDCESHMVWKL